MCFKHYQREVEGCLKKRKDSRKRGREGKGEKKTHREEAGVAGEQGGQGQKESDESSVKEWCRKGC